MIFDDLIGKPYAENGRGPDGFDCYGLCMWVCRKIGIELPEVDELKDSRFLSVAVPRLGDIVLIGHRHVGVMTDRMHFLSIHSTGRRGVHRMRIDHPWISGEILGYYRYAG